jgi:NhaA family Na+:H+ antiporter
MTVRHLAGIGLLGGVGFTMSIFIAGLSFGGDSQLNDLAKSCILMASLIAGVSGYCWLRYWGQEQRA